MACIRRRQLLVYKFVDMTLSQSDVLIAITEVEQVHDVYIVHLAITLSQHMNYFTWFP